MKFKTMAVAVALAVAVGTRGDVDGDTEWWRVPPKTTLREAVQAVPDVAVALTNHANSVAVAATNYTDAAATAGTNYVNAVAVRAVTDVADVPSSGWALAITNSVLSLYRDGVMLWTSAPAN